MSDRTDLRASTPPDMSDMLKKALDYLPDGVLVVSSTRTICYANPAFFEMWRVPIAKRNIRNREPILNHVAETCLDPAAFRDEVARLYGSTESSEDAVVLKDGRILARRSVCVASSHSEASRIWIFTDVTEASHAEIDPMTGLLNRRAYSRRFPAFVSDATGTVAAVALLDIDNFKAYNDTYGHACGDAVIAKVSQIMASMLLEGDLAFRIGGEEFLIARRSASKADHRPFFEEMRISIEQAAIPHKRNMPISVVTASLGVGLFSTPRRPEEVFDAVDGRLYAAKAAGRNMTCFTDLDELPAPPVGMFSER